METKIINLFADNDMKKSLKNEWIKCGLPWKGYLFEGRDIIPVSFDDKVRKKFGRTQEEYFEQEKILACYEKYNKIWEGKPWIKANRHLQEETIMKRHIDVPEVARVLKYAKFRKKVRKWVFNHKEYNKKSFCELKLNKTGTLVEIQFKNSETKTYLIGDINKLGGVCDDCTEFDENSIVKRYKTIL